MKKVPFFPRRNAESACSGVCNSTDAKEMVALISQPSWLFTYSVLRCFGLSEFLVLIFSMFSFSSELWKFGRPFGPFNILGILLSEGEPGDFENLEIALSVSQSCNGENVQARDSKLKLELSKKGIWSDPLWE